ncbi:MAG: phage holin [Paludibacteraceae bacterium]|nr:phage holin [Paludibacteraceae bacterium]
MTGDIFTQIVVAIILLFSALISAYVVPFLQAKTDATEWTKLLSYTRCAVEWANQTIKPDEYVAKKRYVYDKVKEFIDSTLKIQLDEKQIDTIIEAIVNEVKRGI